MPDVDVVVVGAGPAGSTAALHAARGGARVLLLDKREEVGVPVQCAEFLPDVEVLEEMFPRSHELEELFHVPSRCSSRDIPAVEVLSPTRRRIDLTIEGVSLKRALFDQHLARLAVEAGAELRTGAKVLGASPEGVELEDEFITARVVVGADGALSKVRDCLGFPTPALHPCVQYTIPGDRGELVQLFFNRWLQGGHAWLVPKSSGANIGMTARTRRPLRRLLDELVHRRMGIHDRPKLETEGVLPVSGPVAGAVMGNVLLVGDAAGQVPPFTGWGIPFAMVCGRVAGRTASEHLSGKCPLSDYEPRWRAEAAEALQSSLRVRKWMDRMNWSSMTIEFAFLFLGRTGLFKALTCRKIFA